MSDEQNNEDDSQPEVDSTSIPLAYAGASQLVSEGDTARLALFGNLRRDPVFLDGIVRQPLQFREA